MSAPKTSEEKLHKSVNDAIAGKIETLPVYGGKQGTAQFRTPDNVAEMIAYCSSVSHVWFRAMDGSARQAKVNGQVRTWKRDPNRVEVPIKYGLYEYGTFYASDIGRILISV
jgi:hypothetical protein